MTTRETSPQTYARIGGILYLFIIVAALFAEVSVRGGIIVRGEAAATASNLLGSETMFRVSVAGEALTWLCDLTLAMILFVLLERVSRNRSEDRRSKVDARRGHGQTRPEHHVVEHARVLAHGPLGLGAAVDVVEHNARETPSCSLSQVRDIDDTCRIDSAHVLPSAILVTQQYFRPPFVYSIGWMIWRASLR